MRRIVTLLLAVVAVAVAGAGGVAVLSPSVGPTDASRSAGESPVTIRGCTAIHESGTYVLADDFRGGSPVSSSCLRVSASDVTVLGRGASVAGHGASDTTGIAVAGAGEVSNVTIRSVRVANWSRGVLVRNASDVRVSDVRARRNVRGVVVTRSAGVVVRASTVRSNFYGVTLGPRTRNVTLANNTVNGNYVSGVTRRGSSASASLAGAPSPDPDSDLDIDAASPRARGPTREAAGPRPLTHRRPTTA